MQLKKVMHAVIGVILLLASLSAAKADSMVNGVTEHALKDERDCLTDVIFREARSEMVGVWRMVAMVVIARRDDKSNTWPKTICGNVYKPGAFSGIDKPLELTVSDFRIWSQVQRVAIEVYEGAWKDQLLPRGWHCVRYFKLSPRRLAALTPKNREQLGITKGRGLNFFEKLNRVATLGAFSFYEEPGCTPLPTT